MLESETEAEAFEILKDLNRKGGPCCAEIKRGDNAWKCDTCSVAPQTIFCHKCFENGNHEGHRATLTKEASGSCDCGVTNAFRESGFCSDHKDHNPDLFECSDFLLYETMAPAI